MSVTLRSFVVIAILIYYDEVYLSVTKNDHFRLTRLMMIMVEMVVILMVMLQILTMKHLESPREGKLEKEEKEQGRAWLNTLKEKRNIEINFIFVG